MKTETGYSITGEKKEYIRMSYKKGVEFFAKVGFKLCRNTSFMARDSEYVHFNTRQKIWLID